MKSLAVFGGTFNPLHIGHEQMIKTVSSLSFIDKVVLIPTKIPPHKDVDFLASDDDRLAFCELAAGKFGNVSVNNTELLRNGKSYSIDTLREIASQFPDQKIYLVIGGDMMTGFKKWKDYKDILSLASLLVFSRVGVDVDQFSSSVNELTDEGADIVLIETDISEISSTQIRNALSKGECVDGLLPEYIYGYICDNGVYGDL